MPYPDDLHSKKLRQLTRVQPIASAMPSARARIFSEENVASTQPPHAKTRYPLSALSLEKMFYITYNI
jgi:hypothetical protein